MKKKRLIGVKIIAILTIIGGCLGILLNSANLLTVTMPSLVFIGIGLLGIFIGIGLFGFKEWARRSEIAFLILNFLLSIALAIAIGFKSVFLIRWIVVVSFIVYLVHPKVKEQFK
jgi:hypothetical protein